MRRRPDVTTAQSSPDNLRGHDAPRGEAPADVRAGESRPRLLFLCQTLPYPPDGGVQIRTYNVLRLLAREFDVTALCFYRTGLTRSRGAVEESTQALGRFATMHVFRIPQEHSRVRLVWDHLRSVMTGRAYTLFAYDSREFRARLASLLESETFDLVHLDSLDLAGYLPMLGAQPVVCVHHNVESALLRGRALTYRQPLRAYYRLQARLTEREERRECPRVAINIAVSEQDAQDFRRIAPSAQFVVVPNGVDTVAFTPAGPGERAGLVFVGGHSWQPNRDAMRYFCDEILPLLRAAGSDPEVVWVGQASDAAKAEYATRYRVRLTGYVDDIRPVVTRAACYIAPLRAGGGTRLKILDAWAMGQAVVSTSVGCEGLDARDGDNILIRDEPAAFAEAVRAVLTDADLRARLGAGARQTAVARYDWEVIGRDMLRSYRALLRADDRTTEVHT